MLDAQSLNGVILQPDVPWPLIWAVAGFTVVMLALALWRRLPGWWLRTIAGAALLFALLNPSLKQEDREPLPLIVFVVEDLSASQTIDLRPAQMEGALTTLRETIGREDAVFEIIELQVRDSSNGDAGRGTLLMSALAKAAAEEAASQIAGAIVISDGQIEDVNVLKDFPAPVHLILTGRADEWDRRLVLETAPGFGIIGEPVSVTLRIEGLGQMPAGAAQVVPLSISIDGEAPQETPVRVGEPITIELELQHGGQNIVQLSIPYEDGELTDRNNAAVLAINGVRDRLRVLLVSGEPHAGERTWRNLLKSDPAVDLVHFTILRPPHKNDGVPAYELSLIAFPTRELFMDKIDEFDLIIFDRYRKRGVLPAAYMQNIVRYVREGGALLIASGPSLAGAESLYRTPLADIMPLAPTAEVLEEAYYPLISELGTRHPVTQGLEDFAPFEPSDETPGWGRWFRLIDTTAVAGQVVMEGPEARPLLAVDRPGEGRIASLASDHAWLWARGVEGGGPQLELLRRLAHWLMKEPDLEEEVLSATADGRQIMITRRTMSDEVTPLTLTTPDGSEETLEMSQLAPGTYQLRREATQNGLFRLSQGETSAVVVVGPAAPKEYENPVSSAQPMKPLMEATGGDAKRMVDGLPNVRLVREGGVSAGRGWIGVLRRDEAYNVIDIRLTPLAPGWLMMLIAMGAAILAWRIEGR